MYTDIDELDVDAEFPPPTFAGRSDLEDHQLFNGDNWERHSKEELEEAYIDFSALVNFIDKFISPLRKALREVDDMPVHFNELWHLYTPGSMVYVKDPSVPQKLWRVIQGTGGAWSPLQRNTPDAHLDYLRLGGVFGGTRVIPFTLDCYYVDFNGTHFVRVVKKFDIEAFKDPTSIKSLPILPLRVAEKEGLLAQAWDCVLLLDEADVFLAERSQDNIARNALVSVFLRVMEYYEGILFLTTNKVGSFDEAFKSRMSLALYYPPLTQDQTEKIWEVQMRRTEKLSKEAAPDDESQQVKFNRLDILALAKELWMMQQSRADWKPVWNGRQIRNAFQTAVALAEWHQQDKNIAGPIDVKREHFEKVAFVSNEFNAYLYTVKHGRTDENLSLRNQHRADQFDRSSQIPWGGLGFAPQQQYPQFQQQQQGLGGWGNLQNSNVMGGGGQGGMTMGIQGLGNNNFQAQTGFGNPLQSGFGAMGNQVTAGAGMASGGLNNTGVGNSGMSGQNIPRQMMGQQQ
ncbi:hypothetical protein KHU50_001935 [Colletotrichum sp. SAR 10_65]|nr:hypothetical protein KHU50_001935 [Colletotrichum sp. SAR 10_65]KAI8249628.1 hypothetical protein K4K53_013117 [Colletotrichum sp. SAR 10_77]KAJ5002668.1 hypothetical protein K4K48_013151 [Colletotrichum sp. SAR 10_66]